MSDRRGVRVTVNRPANSMDATNGGVSGQCAELTIVGVIDERLGGRDVIELGGMLRDRVRDVAPAVWLHIRAGRGSTGDLYSIVPAQEDGSAPASIAGTYSFGGNWASGGGTFHALTGGGFFAVAIHDRTERRN